MSKVRKIVLGSLFLAMVVVLERLLSFQTDLLRVSFAYVPVVLSGWLLGPGWSVLICVLGDLLGMLLFPKGAYFAGYTLSAALTGLVYGLFLHRAKAGRSFLLRLAAANLIVLVFVSIGLNSLWILITMGRAIQVVLPLRGIAAAIRFPVETGTMFALRGYLENPVRKYLYDDSPSASASTDADADGDASGEGSPPGGLPERER